MILTSKTVLLCSLRAVKGLFFSISFRSRHIQVGKMARSGCCNAILLVLTSIVLSLTPLPGASPQGIDKPVILRVKLPSKEQFLEPVGAYPVVAHLGKLPSASNVKAIIRIENPESFDLPIREITATCGCTKAKLQGDTLVSAKETDLVVDITTPPNSRQSEFVGGLSLNIDAEKTDFPGLQRVQVSIRYEIGGLLNFRDLMIPVDVGAQPFTDIEVPFIYTFATPAKELKIQADGVLAGVKGSILPGDRTQNLPHRVKLSIDSTFASAQGEVGRLTLTEPESGRTSSVDLVLYSKTAVKLSPRTLRFITAETDEDSLTAGGILRLNVEKEVAPDSIRAEATLNDRPLQVNLKRMGGNIYRFHVSGNGAMFQDLPDDSQVAWRIMYADRQVFSKCDFVTTN
ncbi:hypothetical protein [Allorhodopirellula solitaria]|uniref:DUF1573 domain-containing protein n=1 Tax=Allorhodopirellula solitaria TaxID=2527987 RepID=A0A5C5XX65_9BACT|nr:hypothetical protein [Allorhodopirellula solitaria]TWT67129.1 hypothetical protein CA85_19750 [Allorhodopirellula solitaria]